MAITLHNIEGHAPPAGPFHHASSASGSRTIYAAGQTGTGADGNLVEGGLAGQTEQALLNVALALEAAGCGVDDLAKMTFYVVDWDPSMFEALGAGAAAAGERQAFPEVPITLIGVKSLFTPEMVIEIEATAVAD